MKNKIKSALKSVKITYYLNGVTYHLITIAQIAVLVK